jgi:hypothetical protein
MIPTNRSITKGVRPETIHIFSSIKSASRQKTLQVMIARAKCNACGAENVDSGCDGEGRVIGGLGAVPGE